jgi:2,4'-dihydroxyacetophenone dioxygenase
VSIIEDAPSTIHRSEQDLPFVDAGDGVALQLLQVDLSQGIWILRNRFAPGTTIPTHRHTGCVYAFTHRGCWYYLESPEAQNTEGSYLFEPAGSTHTLHVPPGNDGETDVSFVIHGANLDLDDEGRVVNVVDAALVLAFYRAACADQHGLADPPVVVVEASAPDRS